MTHQNRIIRRPEIRGITGLTPSAMDREIRAGRFPRPVPLVPGGRAVGWSEQAVQSWIAERLSAQAA